MAPTPPLDALLENAIWLRNLARQMLADRGLAEDVVQETWMAALQRPPSEGSWRPWLASVLRNFARQRVRSESARARREQAVARRDVLPSADETVARAELHARLVQAVLALEEPYRSTLLWRYFEGLSAEQIAQRARIEPATVRSRVARARERLRETLTDENGEPPERWLAGLLPLGTRLVEVNAGAAALAGIGGLLMGAKWAVAALVIALGATAVWLWRSDDSSAAATPTASSVVNTDASSNESVAEPAPALEQDVEARSLVSAAEQAGSATNAAPTLVWSGVVLSEADRRPIPDARVAYREVDENTLDAAGVADPSRALRTDSQGRFELPRSANKAHGLWFEADEHFPFALGPADLPQTNGTPLEIVLAPMGKLEVEFVDERGAPVEGVELAYSIDVNRGSLEHMWAFRRILKAGRSDAAGLVSLPPVPCGMPIDLRSGGEAGKSEYFGAVHIDPARRELRHRIAWRRDARIVGRLLDESGAPAVGRRVGWQRFPLDYRELSEVRSGPDGRFAFVGVPAQVGELRLDLPGFTPLELAPAAGQTHDVGDLVLPALRELSGRLTARTALSDALLSGVELRLYRSGAVVRGLGSPSDSLPLVGGAFTTRVTDGPLELVVTRGGFYHGGVERPREVLARVALPEPRSDLSVPIDTQLGSLEVEFDASTVLSDGAQPRITLRSSTSDLPNETTNAHFGTPPREGVVRFDLLPAGRFTAWMRLDSAHSGLLGEIEVSAGGVAQAALRKLQAHRLRVRVRDAQGVALEGASVELHGGSTRPREVSDANGQLEFAGLAAGVYSLEVRHGDAGAERLDAVEVLEPLSSVEVTLAGFASLRGRIREGGVPVAGLSIDAQPSGSNDSYNSITDAEGRFAFERLPTCTLRVWAQGKFVDVHTFRAGEQREVELELEAPRTLEITRNGVVLTDLSAVRATALEQASAERTPWRTSVIDGSEVRIVVPSGRVLFEVCRARGGSNLSYLALTSSVGSRVELAPHSLHLDTAQPWSGPLPRATLLSIDGREIASMWARPIDLVVELDEHGQAVVPCLPAGARIEVSGFDLSGARRSETVDVQGPRRLRW
ncbi:MAG: sigma-70 family RNA polymerase sigma factor [Planctomycetes bacterium]|nr:sigma-70 family RNA polymerase sigma factor [Planctomycetota bacterium]